ncbi:outer membrane protein [Geofilum rubicundum JCM 15548]|uniref:Outer membrane protein n=1 Tax=Geofilum rubicundum JCM 15548 TaxID=1236989 RepID=A0A0E9LYN1_9BACT|nr:outer membrane protein [Geofilum rubicundum JCM 15548]
MYSRDKLNRSQQQIYQLGTFRIASMKAQLSRDKKDTIPVKIDITEAPATTTRLGVGFGREDRFRTFVNFRVLNFPGGARRLNFYAKHSALEPYRFEVKLTQPAVFSPNSSLALAPTVKKLKESGYELFSYSATLTLLQRLTDALNSSFSLYYEKVDLDTTSIAKVSDGGILLDNYSKGGVTAGVLFDNASPRFNPSDGFTVAFNAKSNSMILPGRYPFIKFQLEAKNYQEMGDDLILASRIKFGIIHPGSGSNNVIPVEERFFAGGSRSVRGWARQQLGPKDDKNTPTGGFSTVEASIEPRIRLFGPLSMVVFMDVGNVWQKTEDLSIDEIRFSAGGGLRFTTPIGPVGIDAARPVWDTDNQWQIHFNIGHAF